MKPVASGQRRFLFLLSILAALLGACLAVIAKSIVEHASFRNALGSVVVMLFVPILALTIEWLAGALFASALEWVKVKLPAWCYKLTVAALAAIACLFLVDDFLGLGIFP